MVLWKIGNNVVDDSAYMIMISKSDTADKAMNSYLGILLS
jgi:hypothetical protein